MRNSWWKVKPVFETRELDFTDYCQFCMRSLWLTVLACTEHSKIAIFLLEFTSALDGFEVGGTGDQKRWQEIHSKLPSDSSLLSPCLETALSREWFNNSMQQHFVKTQLSWSGLVLGLENLHS